MRHFERARATTDGDSTVSARAMALRACGICRTTAHTLETGGSIKDLDKRKSFDNAFRTHVAAEVGSEGYRKLWAEVRDAIEGVVPRHLNLEYVVGSAYSHWAGIAVDASQPVADRLLAGRIAEYVLYHYSRKKRQGRAPAFGFEISAAAAESRSIREARGTNGRTTNRNNTFLRSSEQTR